MKYTSRTYVLSNKTAIELAAQDIWMSMRRFNGRPDQVHFAGLAY
jgi:hypothetical protein